MSSTISNIFEKGTPLGGGVQGPTQTSAFERATGGAVTQENSALVLSGGRTSSLFLAGAGKIFEGIDGLSRAKSAFNQAKLLRFDARSAEIEGEANAVSALEALNDIQATNIVASFASGIRLQGSTAVVQQVVASQADFSQALSKANAQLKAGGFRRKAAEAEDFARRTKKRAKADIFVGVVTGGASLFL